MPKQAWFFKNKTVWGIFGVMLVFAMFAAGCPSDGTDPDLTTYTVTFETDGGTAVAPLTVEDGKTVAKPANPTKAGNTFANWYRDADKTTLWNFGTDVVVQATTIYAKWVPGEDVQPYKVTFNADGGLPAPAEQSVYPNEPVQEPARPDKTGYIFDGWYNGAAEWNFSTDKVTAATALTAKWIEAVTVTFNTNGGSAIAPLTVAKGDDVPLYYRPIKSGNVFDGWYTDAALTTPAESGSITESLTLYAKWISTSELAPYAGVWWYEGTYSYDAFWLQADGTAWGFSGSDSYFGFSKLTWSTSQIDGYPAVFNEAKNEFTWYGDTYTKNTTTTKTPAAATGDLLGVWVNGGEGLSIELKANGDAVLKPYYSNSDSNTITLKYCAETDAVYLLQPETNLVILSIGITDGKLSGDLSKPTSDSSLAGIWKLTEKGQDYYWNLKADGSGTFHTLGASVPFSFIVTDDKRIDGYGYEVSGSTLTLPGAGWDNETYTYIDLEFTKVASVPAGSGADGDSRLHGTWKAAWGTITINANGTYGEGSESYIWKADGSAFYIYYPDFVYGRDYPQNYTISGSTLTMDGWGVFTKQ